MEDLKRRLVEEHRIVKVSLIGYIESILPEYKRDPNKYFEYVEGFVANIRRIQEKHFRFEEEQIFPHFSDNPLVTELRREHDHIRRMLDRIVAVSTMDEKIGLLQRLVEIIRDHLHKEDEKLQQLLK